MTQTHFLWASRVAGFYLQQRTTDGQSRLPANQLLKKYKLPAVNFSVLSSAGFHPTIFLTPQWCCDLAEHGRRQSRPSDVLRWRKTNLCSLPVIQLETLNVCVLFVTSQSCKSTLSAIFNLCFLNKCFLSLTTRTRHMGAINNYFIYPIVVVYFTHFITCY